MTEDAGTTVDDSAEIDPHHNRESEAAQHDQSSAIARAGNSGMTAMGGGPGPENPAYEVPGEGTTTGNPVAGVTIDEADRAQAVDGDMGPEHPGAPAQSAGHA